MTQRRIGFVPFLLVALAPVLFALVTWNDSGPSDNVGLAIRLFGFPIHFVEICFIGWSLKAGWLPLRAFHELPAMVRLLLIALVVTAFGTASFSAPNPAGSLIWTYLSLVHLLFGFAAAWMISHAEDLVLDMVWPSVALSSLAYAALLAVFAAMPHRAGFDWLYFGLAVSNIRQVGFYVVVGAMAATGCALTARGFKAVMFAAVASLLFVVSFWTGSRGAPVASVLAIGTGVLITPLLRTVRGLVLSILPIAMGAILAIPLPQPTHIYGVNRFVSSMQAQSADTLSGFRLGMWKGAGDAFLHRPWFGYGEAQFGIVVPQPLGIYLHPHNVLLQMLFQWGIVGTTICLTLGVIAARRLEERLTVNNERSLPAALAVMGLLAFSLFDGTLFHAFPVMMFGFALAFGLTANSPALELPTGSR